MGHTVIHYSLHGGMFSMLCFLLLFICLSVFILGESLQGHRVDMRVWGDGRDWVHDVKLKKKSIKHLKKIPLEVFFWNELPFK